MVTFLIYSHFHLQIKWIKNAQPALAYEWLILQPQDQSFNQRHLCIEIPGGDSPSHFSKRKMNPVPGWFPHHWHYLSHWQWFRLPPPSKSSLKEETLQPHVWWINSYILSFTSIPHLSCSACPFPSKCSNSPLTEVPGSPSCQPYPYFSHSH